MFDLRNVKTNDEIMVRDKDDEQWMPACLLCVVGDLCFVRATKNSTGAKGFKQAKRKPVNWDEIPAGVPIIVWNDADDKLVRKFAFEKNGKIYVKEKYENERSFWEYDNAELIDEHTDKRFWKDVPVGTKCLFRQKRSGRWEEGFLIDTQISTLYKVDYSKENE